MEIKNIQKTSYVVYHIRYIYYRARSLKRVPVVRAPKVYWQDSDANARKCGCRSRSFSVRVKLRRVEDSEGQPPTRKGANHASDEEYGSGSQEGGGGAAAQAQE